METLWELQRLIDRYCTEGWNTSILPRVSLVRSETDTTMVPIVYNPVLCIVAQGSRSVVLQDTSFTYGVGTHLLASVDLPVRAAILEGSSEHPFLSFGLLLDEAVIASLILDMPKTQSLLTGEPSLGMAIHETSEELLLAVVRLLRLLQRPEDIPILAPLAEREILYCLLKSSQGAMLRQLAHEDSRLKQISSAIQWIRRNYDKPFRIETIAELANMSGASLHRHFKTITSMSPLQFQKQIRLREARRLLIENAGDAASVGFTVGYGSSTQFSREYSRQFGTPPGRDGVRLRDSKLDSAAF